VSDVLRFSELFPPGQVARLYLVSDVPRFSELFSPGQVARLYLVSDILHNTTAGVRNASRYRSRLEEELPDVFESLAGASRACESRMTQEALRRCVLRLLRVWRDWFIFADDFLNGLQVRGPDAFVGARVLCPPAAREALADTRTDTLTTLTDTLDRQFF
jgi:CID domain